MPGPLIAPWLATLLATLGGSLLASFIGGGKQRQTTTTETPRRGYQSPFLGLMDPATLGTLAENFQLYRNFGLPPGAQQSGSWMDEVLKVLKQQMPLITGGYMSSRQLPASYDFGFKGRQ